MFKLNDKICIATDLCDPNSIRTYTVTKVGKDTLQCNGSVENTFYTAFCWPISVIDELRAICTKRQELKANLDNSMSLVYELRNKLPR